MKTKAQLFTLLILFGFFPTSAQESEIKTLTKDVGFNTTFLLNGLFNSSSTPFSIMYKKYTSENKANRFGVDLSMNVNDASNDQGGPSDSEHSNATLRINIGREFQKPISPKWIWYYGGDLVPFYQFSTNENFQGGEKVLINKSSSFGLAARPFLAIRYNIIPRLYVSAEASLNLGYSRSTQYIEYPQSAVIETDSHNNNLSLYLAPASGFFLYYRF